MLRTSFPAAVLAGLLGAGPAAAQDAGYRTPRAGEPVVGTVFGSTVTAAARDRARITYLGLGGVFLVDGPDGLGTTPSGGLYLWRVGSGTRLRAIVAGIANEVRWDHAPPGGALSRVLTFDSLTLPWARSEYADGRRARAEDLEWHQARLGIGAAWRRPLGPGAVDNGLDVALTAEGGGLWFDPGSHADPALIPPRDTTEARVHVRVRADALERNLVELPHAGWAAGADLVAAWRGTWEPWGAPELETGGSAWQAASVFALAAFGLPGITERHRLIASLHAGIGGDLDRFSAFRLGSGSTWGDFETLSRTIVPGAGVDEIAAARYATVDLEYRYEALFFLYLQLRGTLAYCDHPVRAAPGLVTVSGSFPAVTAGLTTGLPWSLALELAGSYNFGLPRDEDGRVTKGSAGFLVSLTREF